MHYDFVKSSAVEMQYVVLDFARTDNSTILKVLNY